MALFASSSSVPKPFPLAAFTTSGNRVPTPTSPTPTVPTTGTPATPVTTAAAPTVAPQQQVNAPSPLTHGWTSGMVGPSYRILQSILGPGSGVTTQGAPSTPGAASGAVPGAVSGGLTTPNVSGGGLFPAVNPNISPNANISKYWMSLSPTLQKQIRTRVGSNLLNTLLEGSGSSKSQYYSLLPKQQTKIQKRLTPEQLAGLTGLSTSQYNSTYGANGWVPNTGDPTLLY